DVRVPDFTDGAGHQVPVHWSWIGPRPGIIELRAPAALLIESTLPAPATYRTIVEVIYSSRDATGKNVIRPLRIPLRVERTAVTPPTPESELPIAGIDGDTVEVELFRGPATADVGLVVRGTAAQPVTIDRAVLITAARKGSGGQLVENAAVATVTRGLPTTIARGEVRTIALNVSGLEGPGVFDAPGNYDGKLLVVNATTGATKVIGFTVVVHRCAGVALALIMVGVLVSFGTRRWLQEGRARAIARRDLSVLQNALSRILKRDPGDADRNAAVACGRRLSELFRDGDNGGFVAAVGLLWKRVTVLESVVEARKTVAMIPGDDRQAPSLTLDSIAGALARDLDETELRAAQEQLRGLDLEKAFRAAVTALVRTLERRLDERSTAHADRQARWTEIGTSLQAAGAELERGHVLTARGPLATGYRMFTLELGTLLRELAITPPPQADPATWQAAHTEMDRLLDQLATCGEAEAAARLHARALTVFLRVAAPALATASRTEAAQRPTGKADFESLATSAEALLVHGQPDDDDTYRALLRDLARLEQQTPRSVRPSGLETVGAPPPAAPLEMNPTKVDAALAALGTTLPSPEVLTGRIKLSSRAVDVTLFVLAVLTGLQVLWVGNATWGTGGDMLASLLWGAGVHAVGQTVARGVLGLKADFLGAA
ncbi:MAG: hypothetical protein ABIY55_35580, partial [Kofleriaceae bacterium]